MRSLSFRYALLLPLFLLFAPASFGADDMSKEIALGKKAAAELEQRWELDSDPVLAARLDMILARLVPFTSRPLPYEVRVAREEEKNAFSLPGGIIYFTDGMLKFLRSDAEIAAIMAHELAHADRRHVIIQTARSSKISLAAIALMVASHGAAGPMILTSLLQVAVTNSYGMDLEREADREGFRMLESAGLPPAAMVTPLEAMIFDQMKRPYVDPGVFMTHPELAERVDNILRMAEEMKVPIERKRALHLLRPSTSETEETILLAVDGTEIWRARRSPAAEDVAKAASAAIEGFLQMETAPYDIQVIDLGGERALHIGPAIVMREPLPEGATPLETLRESLVAALGAARDKHQGTNYHR